jgi:hypothetical protein
LLTCCPQIWSIGCVTLEFLVWILYGYRELEVFNSKIVGESGQESPYFEIKRDENGRTDIVHPAVKSAIDAISRDQECREDTALSDLLKIVRNKLLVVALGNTTMRLDVRRPENEGISGEDNQTRQRPVSGLEPKILARRASAWMLLDALDDILRKGAANEKYFFTGKNRDHITRIQMPSVVTTGPNTPNIRLSPASPHEDVAICLREASLSRPNSTQVVSLTVPSVHKDTDVCDP